MATLIKLYMIMIPLVVLAAFVEGLWLSRTRSERYDWRASATSLADLAVRRALMFLPYSLTAPLFAVAYEHRLFTQTLDSVWSVLLLFVSLEFFYYWFHRASHTVRWFWNSHSVHHSPNQLTLAAAYRLGWLGRFIGATVFFAPMSFLGFEPTTVLAALFLNLLYQFWLHADWIPKLGVLEYVLNTPSNHRVHHARNPEYLDANYGGVLIVFDRLFGTYIEERADLPCDYGLVSRATTYNPIRINFEPWLGLARDLASARSPGDAWMFLFGPPGWRPDGKGLTTAELRRAHIARLRVAQPQVAEPQAVMT